MTHDFTEEERKTLDKEFLNKLVIKTVDRSEAETCINFQRYDDDFAYIWTTDNVVYTKLKKHVFNNPDQWKINRITYCREKVTGVEFKCPKRFISFREKDVSRTFTDSEKEASRARMSAINSSAEASEAEESEASEEA